MDSAPSAPPSPLADVVQVEVSRAAEQWVLSVTVRSPDTGCDQYADWWEVLDADGTLRYRRILNHSHVDEQPFTRSGGPVPVGGDDALIVRAHLSPDGYGGAAMSGTASGGFVAADVDADFAASVASDAPQPDGCAY